ncbi:MAG: hypothetical protein LBT90_02150 [Holosporaceae bacterium]|nr:hypothetical protein [Holosporaceae bacterium]
MKFINLLIVLFSFAGCSIVEHSQKNVPTIASSMDAFYFTDVFLDASEVDIKQQTKKLGNEYSWKSERDIFNNSFTCSYHHKNGGESDGGEISCQYLGNWHGQDIVARHYRTGGSGSFSDILFCSMVSGKLRRYKIILPGDRADGGLLPHPMFDGKGKIYFHMYLSNATLLKESGLDEKIVSGDDGSTCCTCYGIVGKCVYNIEEGKMKILSMTSFSDKNKNSKITSLIKAKAHNGIAIFSEKETQEFLKKLRELYASK